MTTPQVKAFTLEVEGSTKAIQALLDVESAIGKNAAAIKKLKADSDAAGKTLGNLTTENEKLVKTEQSLQLELERVDKRMAELLKTNKQASKEYKDLKALKEELIKKERDTVLAIEKNNQAQAKHNKTIDIATQGLIKHKGEVAKLKQQQALLNKEVKDSAKDFDAQAKRIPRDSIAGLSREYSKLIVQYEQMSRAERKSAAGRELVKHLERISREANEASLAVNNFKRNIGNYPDRNVIGNLSQFSKAALAAFGVGSALFIGVGLLKSAATTVREFNSAQIELQALSGQSAEQLKDLTDNAKELGATTLFTATSVTKLQVELSKLGFNNQEILNATKSVIDFAVAMEADAAAAATIAASTMRAFGIETRETARVVSVLGVAANKTALSFEDFDGNIATFAPVARQFGFSLEDSIALFGRLRDAGFDASTAATALRNIFLKMADENGDLAKRLGRPIKTLNDLVPALQKLKKEGVDLGEAFELTGERSVAAFGQLLEDADTLIALRDGLTNVNEEFRVMVEKRLKSVDAQLKLTKGAWEAMVISIDEGDGTISKAVAGFLSNLRGAFEMIRQINDGIVTMDALLSDLNELFLFSATGTLSEIFGITNISEQAVTFQQETHKALERNALEQAKKLFDIAQKGTEDEKKQAEKRIESIRKNAEAGDKLAKEFVKQYELLAQGLAAATDPDDDDGAPQNIIRGIEYLEGKISELNKVLQNTTSETVIIQTAKQIHDLMKEVEALEARINRAKILAEGGRDETITQPINQITTESITTRITTTILDPLELKAQKKRAEDQLKLEQEFEAILQDGRNRFREDDLARQQEYYDQLVKQQYEYNAAVGELFAEFGDIVNSIFSGQEKDTKEVFKKLLLATLKFAEAQVKIAATAAKSISSVQAIALGPLGVAKATLEQVIIQGLISAAFAALRGIVQSFRKGLEAGKVKDYSGKTVGDSQRFTQPGSDDNVLIHAKVGERVINAKQQKNAERLYGPGVWRAMQTGRAAPVANQLIRETMMGSTVATMSDENIKSLAREVATEVGVAVESGIKRNRLLERAKKLQ